MIEQVLALVLFYIDRFLNINETSGHSAGDQVFGIDIVWRVCRIQMYA